MTEKFHLSVGSLSPSQEQLSNLLEHYQAGRLAEAENLAVLESFSMGSLDYLFLGNVVISR